MPRANVYGVAKLRAKLDAIGFENVDAEDVSERITIWNNARSRTFYPSWAKPLRHPAKLNPSPLEKLLGLAHSAVDGAAWNLYCFTTLNLNGLHYYIYTAQKPRGP